ncbi:MAG: hypothetical protein HY687_01920 [Chloroflexi bacterium]|nr:hypothetical protein [Chloroflexota bacterium]
MTHPDLTQLIGRLPAEDPPFQDTDFPYPVNNAIYGKADFSALKNGDGAGGDIMAVAHRALALAEAIEAAQPDRGRFFTPDDKFRSNVVGSKSALGWALLMGDADHGPLGAALAKERYTVFTAGRELPKTTFLGERDTAAVYFAQSLLRYALVYGKVAPGDTHSLEHFLRDEGMGVIVVQGKLTPVEDIILLAMMDLGIRAVLPGDYPFPYGEPARADGVVSIMARLGEFPNMRIRSQRASPFALPAYANPAFARDEVVPVRSLGDSERSFFLVRQAPVADGVEIEGEMGRDLGILIEVASEHADAVVCNYLETQLASLPSYVKGVKSTRGPESLVLGLAEGVTLTAAQLAETLHKGAKYLFPSIGPVRVTLVTNPQKLLELKPQLVAYRQGRLKAIAAETEETAKEFYGCNGCSTFAINHHCVITPERTPQCGRAYALVKTGSRFMVPVDGARFSKRREVEAAMDYCVLEKGRVIDPLRGEYEGVNRAVAARTKGRLKRVFLHSLFESPHSSCGCFGNLAFYMPEVDGIGVMHRGFEGAAPNGRTWGQLANAAAGSQTPGVAGVSIPYINSPKFLQSDGGYQRVVWMTRKLYDRLSPTLKEKYRIATEEDAHSLEGLRAFLKEGKKVHSK